ncbi:MAG: barstar family protein [Bacteroidaceae bacterium]|nr:barstar family protein [Bacteroidaceae bacterium]
MNRRTIIIDGNLFDTEEGFYDLMDKLLTKDLPWKTGHNLDAFNDLLRGGFGVHEDGEPLEIVWLNSEKSKKDLGYKATIEHWEEILTKCHSSANRKVRKKISDAKKGIGKTLFDDISEIICNTNNSGHDCTLILR